MDEDVSALVAVLLRSRGYVATSAREEDQFQHTDREQLDFAIKHGRAIVTHNRDHFVALANEYFASERNHYGIIIARHGTPQEIVRLLITILDHVTADEFQNQVRYI